MMENRQAWHGDSISIILILLHELYVRKYFFSLFARSFILCRYCSFFLRNFMCPCFMLVRGIFSVLVYVFMYMYAILSRLLFSRHIQHQHTIHILSIYVFGRLHYCQPSFFHNPHYSSSALGVPTEKYLVQRVFNYKTKIILCLFTNHFFNHI